MAVSFARVNTNPTQAVLGDRMQLCTDLTLDNSYPTGGYALGLGTYGFSTVDFVDAQLLPIAGAVVFLFNYATQKLQAFANTGAETTNATNLSTVTGRVQVLGKGFVSGALPN